MRTIQRSFPTGRWAGIAFLFAQQGLMAGATIEGTKYTRILR